MDKHSRRDRSLGNVLYFFKGGRRQRLEAIAEGRSPTEFLYGLVELRKEGADVELIEQNALPGMKKNVNILSDYQMILTSWALRKWCEIAFSGSRYSTALEYLNKFDVIIAIPDSNGLALGYLRQRGWLTAKVIMVCMATAMKLENNRKQNFLAYHFSRNFVQQAIKGCDRLLALGEGERTGLEAEFGPLPGLKLLPFAVDTQFWHPGESRTVGDPVVLFIGNDLNRDFELLVWIAESMPEVRFRFITGMLTGVPLPENVELIKSDWHECAVSDEDIRAFYQQSTMVIIPLRDTLQPSGQSVCLQAMACGTPVVISRTKGFWEPGTFIDAECCLFIEEPHPMEWKSAIELLLQDDVMSQEIALNARALVEQRYDISDYAREIQKQICELQQCKDVVDA